MTDVKRQTRLNFKQKPICKYGATCYQKNPEHLRNFRHPPRPETQTEAKEKTEDEVSVLSKKRKSETSTDESSNDSVEVPLAKILKKSPSRKEEVAVRSPSPSNIEENIKEKFLVNMPVDFYEFWDFCKTINNKNPTEAFAELKLHLVGPYDVLASKIKNSDISSDNILCHWRYYYDPPEFQTVIKRDGNEGYHIGYFRDHPSEMPFGLASNSASVGPKLTLIGDNIFAAINSEISDFVKHCDKALKDKFKKIRMNLQKLAEEKGYNMEIQTQHTKRRNKGVVTKTFHGLGIVVPVDEVHEVGYRPLPETDAKLKATLKRICDCETEERRVKMRVELDNIITNVQFATDECDYGMGLELGIDLFCFGDEYLHGDILCLLPVAYTLLNRSEYSRILKAHLSNRRKGNNLSIKDM